MRTQLGYQGRSIYVLALLAFVGAAIGAASAGTWLTLAPDNTWIMSDAAAVAPNVFVARSDMHGIDVAIDLDGIELTDYSTPAGDFVLAHWPDAGLAGTTGDPAIPVVRKLFVAPPGAAIAVTSADAGRTTLNLAVLGYNNPILPVQAPIPMVPGAREAAPFNYNADAYVSEPPSAVLANVTEVGTVRDQRLCMLEVYPVAYAPTAGTLTVSPHVDVSISFSGGNGVNGVNGFSGDLGPMTSLNALLLNPLPPAPADRSLNYLVVAAQTFCETGPLNALIASKIAQGMSVTTYAVPEGASKETIKAYIASVYAGLGRPDYVLLVGDTNYIPAWTGGGDSSADTDIPYVCMDPGDDWLPDMTVGRFPVRTPDQLIAIVEKTLYVEGGSYTDPDYVMRAALLAGNDETSGDHDAHDRVINNYLIPNEYRCRRVWYRVDGSDTPEVTAAVNAGAMFTVYFGHSGSDHWFKPVYYQSHVQALANPDRYGIVISFSCNTGRYTVSECFGETWVLESKKGAALYLGTSTYIYWTSPPWVETSDLYNHFFYSIYRDQRYHFGDAVYGGLYRLLAQYGSADPVSRDYFEMFIVLGDPALRIPVDAAFSLDAAPDSQAICAGADAAYTIDVERVFEFTDTVTLTVDGLPEGAMADFSVNGAEPPFTTVLTISGTDVVASGDYTLEITGVGGDVERSLDVLLNVSAAVPNAVVPTNPVHGAFDVPLKPTLKWAAMPWTWEYDYEVATDPDFTNVVASGTVSTPGATLDAALASHALHYWRVRGRNGCGDGAFSSIYRFTTVEVLAPIAYDMHNGQTGSYTYYDDTYDGDGSPGVSLSWLSNGLGDLTDGVIATQRWNQTPVPYVGWRDIDPTITFHFASVVTVRSVTVHADDSNGSGGVYPPSDVQLVMGDDVLNFTVQDPLGGEPFAIMLDGLALTGDTLVVKVYDVISSHWQMLSEIVIYGGLSAADLDADGDVDAQDFANICTCVNGPDVTTPPAGCDPADFAAADLDGDGDVDLADMNLLSGAYTGP